MLPTSLVNNNNELFQEDPVDVWSVAVSIYKLASGELPFAVVGSSREGLVQMLGLLRSTCDPMPPVTMRPNNLGHQSWEVLRSMMHIDPSERVCMAEALQLWQAACA